MNILFLIIPYEQEYGQRIMTSPSENDEYTIEMTPILLAAENNNYHSVKVNAGWLMYFNINF